MDSGPILQRKTLKQYQITQLIKSPYVVQALMIMPGYQILF